MADEDKSLTNGCSPMDVLGTMGPALLGMWHWANDVKPVWDVADGEPMRFAVDYVVRGGRVYVRSVEFGSLRK